MRILTTAALLSSIVGIAILAGPLSSVLGQAPAAPAPGAGAAPAPGAGGGRAGRGPNASDTDRQKMLDLLNIKELRPAKPNSGSWDESKANPFPNLPDPLTFKDKSKVTTAAQWPKRRAEIMEDFDREVYGRVPTVTPAVKWEVTATTEGMTGTIPTVTRQLTGHVDNSSYPAITVDISMSITLPANAAGPSPVMLIFGGGIGGGARRGGAPGAPAAPGAAPAAPRGGAMAPFDGNEFFVAAPAGPNPAPGAAPAPDAPVPGGRRSGRGGAGGLGGGLGGRGGGGPSWQETALSKGWGFASVVPNGIQADNGAGLTAGIIGLCNKGQPRKPDDWGSLRAWAWGASRALDFMEKDPKIDAKAVGLEGHSRYGKATVVAMAYDERFAIAYVSSSGEGGAKLHRRMYGEEVENVAATNEYHWMAGNFLKYAGPLTWGDMPVDSHELIAMCAPRPCFLSTGTGTNPTPDSPLGTGGDLWVDPKGTFLAGEGASSVYKLLGKKGMSDAQGNPVSQFPPTETPLTGGDVAYRQHASGHTDGPNWPTFFTFAQRYIKDPGLKN